MDPASIARYNQERMEITAANPITAFGVGLQMAHRIVAALILVVVLLSVAASKKRLGWKAPVTKLNLLWACLIFSEAALGAATIWTNKSADIATAHVAVGALSLMTGAMAILVALRTFAPEPKLAGLPESIALPGKQQKEMPA